VGAAPLLALTGVTFLSRLALFAGVKRIGGMQTSLLGLAELLVAVLLAHLVLAESLSASQWLGAALLAVALLLAVLDPGSSLARTGRGWLHWLTPPEGAVAVEAREGAREV
jgi:drug/metabolite transporter (DMT)-like permease